MLGYKIKIANMGLLLGDRQEQLLRLSLTVPLTLARACSHLKVAAHSLQTHGPGWDNGPLQS